ncbi:protein TolR [Maritalea sp.]|jgi:biopolymer transport protein TolR|uniref:protein TolR n=1 Tax=Maritalea sp. TaxID=2003361 RepID=UPI0039E37327
MGMSAGGGRSGSRRGRRGKNRPMSEINVTPLVDVMLVLLIVFMVAAPLLTVGVPIDLPQSQAKSLNTDSKPITVSVTSAGDVYVLEDKIDPAELISTIQALIPEGTDERIYVRGDTVADYGSVMKVMGQLSGAGYTKIGLITEQEQGQ